jgi:rhodanese-related sulfurtransferase
MKELGLESFKELLAKSTSAVVDTRLPETFANGFIGESVSIYPDENFLPYLNDLISDEQEILFVADEEQVPEIDKIIRGAGLTNVAGYLSGGFETWKNSERAVDLLIAIDAEEFAMDYQFDEFFLVDVRPQEEFEKEHVEDAESISLSDLVQILPQLETSQSFYVYGSTAAEAVTAASILKQYGFQRIRAVAAAYEDLKNTRVPFFVQKKKDKPGPPLPNAGPANR